MGIVESDSLAGKLVEDWRLKGFVGPEMFVNARVTSPVVSKEKEDVGALPASLCCPCHPMSCAQHSRAKRRLLHELPSVHSVLSLLLFLCTAVYDCSGCAFSISISISKRKMGTRENNHQNYRVHLIARSLLRLVAYSTALKKTPCMFCTSSVPRNYCERFSLAFVIMGER